MAHYVDYFTIIQNLECSKGSNSEDNSLNINVFEDVKLGLMFDQFSKQHRIKTDTVRFLFDGERIGYHATPKSLGLKMNDIIDIFEIQEGGVGGTRMPHNNRVSSSGSMKMTDIWTNTIKYDPYAAEGELEGKAEGKAESLARAKGIMALAKISNEAQGNTERSTDFATQVFWGLKRKAPPKGYEVAILSDEDSSSDEDDENSDNENDTEIKNKRSRSISPESLRKRNQDDKSERVTEKKTSKKTKSKKSKKEKKEKKTKGKKSHKKKTRKRD